MPNEKKAPALVGAQDRRPPNPPGSLRSRNRQRTYDEIYEAAMDLFLAKGYEEVSVEQICASAGVGRATFFRYFGTKFALVDEFNRRLSLKIQQNMRPETTGASDCLRHAADAVFDHWVGSAPQLRMLSQQFLSSQIHLDPDMSNPDMARDLRDTVAQIIRRGQKNGDYGGKNDPSVIASLLLWGWTAATASWFETNNKREFRRSIRSITDMFIRGLENQDPG